MAIAYIALGSNLGKRQMTLRGAIARLGELAGTKVLAVANFRFTAPVGGPAGQPEYLNGAVKIETSFGAAELMRELLRIEQEFGRDRSREERNGPRVLDLDLLMYDDLVIDEPGLTVPHPRMAERLFVLDPLSEIAAEVLHPVLKETIAELRAKVVKRG